MFDDVEQAMGKVDDKELEKLVLSLRYHHIKLLHNIATLTKEDFYNRWHIMTTDLHHVGAMLDPYLVDHLSIHEDVVVNSCFQDAMRRLTTSIDGHYGRVVAIIPAFKEHSLRCICHYAFSHESEHSTP